MIRWQWAARCWYGLTALVVIAGIGIQSYVTSGQASLVFHTATARVLNMFCYFTIQSNIVVGVVSALLALRLRRDAMVFRVFALVGLICILITGLVYHMVLAKQSTPTGLNAVANFLLHTASPVLYVLGWVIFGPREGTSARVIGWSALPPICWLIFTLVRGSIVHWYPYTFLDVISIGYARTALDCVLVLLLFLALAALAYWLDRKLVRTEQRLTHRG